MVDENEGERNKSRIAQCSAHDGRKSNDSRIAQCSAHNGRKSNQSRIAQCSAHDGRKSIDKIVTNNLKRKRTHYKSNPKMQVDPRSPRDQRMHIERTTCIEDTPRLGQDDYAAILGEVYAGFMNEGASRKERFHAIELATTPKGASKVASTNRTLVIWRSSVKPKHLG